MAKLEDCQRQARSKKLNVRDRMGFVVKCLESR